MSTKMTQAMRKELTDAIRDRYAAAANNDKRRILDEFIAATGYHEKSAIRVLNNHPQPRVRQTRKRPSIYDEAARGALIVLWEASDRVCGKRLKALLPILLPALERNGHLKLEVEIRSKILSMSAATIDRLLQMPRRATRSKKVARTVPEPRRRIRMRTFADWNEPPPGSMEMDLVAHCGEVNRGSYVHSLVLTDIASGWTEAAPIVVRESSLVVETLERIRVGLPFTLRALDVDNGSEFVNNRLIEYCLGHGIELTRSRPFACRRLEEFPNINAMQLFEELCVQFPGRFTRKQYKTLVRRVSLWRQAARARGVIVGPKTYRRFSDKPRGRRPDIFREHWEEMAMCLEEGPDQTALELLVEFQVRYPGCYSMRQLHTLQRRVRTWRQQAVKRLIGDVPGPAPYDASTLSSRASG